MSFRPGGFSGGTLNTSNWVSAASRDVYESHRQGAWHSNGYGFETRLSAVVFDHPTLGKISTDPAAATPGQARVVITGSATFELKVKPPGGPSEFFSGEDLVGSEFVFEVKYSGGPIYVSKLRILDHVSDPKGGALFEFHKVDPVTGDVVAPICEMSSNGDRLAAVFSDFSINTTTGAVSVTDKVIHIACTGASPGKSPLFGYGPKQGLDAFRLANRVIRADYCADGHPYTYPGNSLEIRDNFLPGSEGTTLADVYADLGDLELEAMWDENGILCMETPRVSTLEGLDIVCPVKTVAGQPSHNWKPPACDTFVDPNPTAMRFFSLTEPES
ncbi:MAG: ADYC domain-containing protein [Nannocystaceae bacterium]